MRRMWMAVVIGVVQPALAEPAYWPLERVPAREPSVAIAGFHKWRDACDDPTVPEVHRAYVGAWCTFAAGDHRAAIKQLARVATPVLRKTIEVDLAVMVADTFTGAEAARWYLDRYAPMSEIDLAIAAFATFGKRADAEALIAATEARIPREAKDEACKRIVRNAAITTSSSREFERALSPGGCSRPALEPPEYPVVVSHWWDLIDVAPKVGEETAVELLEAARDELACNEQGRVTLADAAMRLMVRRGRRVADLVEREIDLAATPGCRPTRQLFPITLDR